MATGHKLSLVGELNWACALSNLSICCAGDDAGAAIGRVREFNALLQLLPSAAAAQGVHPLSLTRLEGLLGAGACESAVIGMLSVGPAFMISRASDGGSFATTVLPGLAGEKSCAGATPALALTGALALALASAHASFALGGWQSAQDARPALH